METQMKITKVKAVTRTLFKKAENKEYYFKETGPIEVGKELKGQKVKEGEAKKAPAKLMPVIDMSTGEEGQIIVGATLESDLTDAYEGQSYVGKTFELVRHGLRDGVNGNRYRTYGITEVSIEEGDIEEAR